MGQGRADVMFIDGQYDPAGQKEGMVRPDWGQNEPSGHPSDAFMPLDGQ